MKLTPEHSIVEQKVEDGLLLLRDSGEYIVLNPLAARIWRAIREGQDLESLVTELAALKGAPPKNEVQRAVSDLIDGLKGRGYLRENA